jgi:DNA-binding NarL/FixJ family response regulator
MKANQQSSMNRPRTLEPADLQQMRLGTHSRGDRGLSRREREVLSLIALGKTDRQIAEDLYISRITVSNHVVHILDKLEVPNRTAAATYAAANALIHPFIAADAAGTGDNL